MNPELGLSFVVSNIGTALIAVAAIGLFSKFELPSWSLLSMGLPIGIFWCVIDWTLKRPVQALEPLGVIYDVVAIVGGTAVLIMTARHLKRSGGLRPRTTPIEWNAPD